MSVKILLVCPYTLNPVNMMAQVRVINVMKILIRKNDLSIAVFCKNRDEEKKNREFLEEFGCRYFILKLPNHRSSFPRRLFYKIKSSAMTHLAGVPKKYTYFNSLYVKRQLMKILRADRYDALHMNYWFTAPVFKKLKNSEIKKVIDTHAMVEEIIETLSRRKTGFFKKRELVKALELQHRMFDYSDAVVPISVKGEEIFKKSINGDKSVYVPIGMDLKRFTEYRVRPEPGTVLFYGTIGSQQNRTAFWNLWNHVFPLIREQYPEARLLVVGSNPTEKIKALHNGKDVVVTGFVDDPREFIAKSDIMILPLETGAGFRGRIIEILAMGVPVAGTNNALESAGIRNGETGFISDSFEELADMSVKLMQNRELREKISRQGKNFVVSNYSLEASGKNLISYYESLSDRGEE